MFQHTQKIVDLYCMYTFEDNDQAQGHEFTNIFGDQVAVFHTFYWETQS